jgi:hypothetical protein
MLMDTDRRIQKLGLKLGQRAFTLHAPTGYTEFLHIPEPADSLSQLDRELDWIQAFYTEKALLEVEINVIKQKLATTGQFWISWPKKSAALSTTLSDESVRAIGLRIGLVDIKVAAIDETWSGLKFVYRLQDR